MGRERAEREIRGTRERRREEREIRGERREEKR